MSHYGYLPRRKQISADAGQPLAWREGTVSQGYDMKALYTQPTIPTPGHQFMWGTGWCCLRSPTILNNHFHFCILSSGEFLSEAFKKKRRNGIPDWMMMKGPGDTLVAHWFLSVSTHIECLLSDTLRLPEPRQRPGPRSWWLATPLWPFYFRKPLRSHAAGFTGKVALAFIASVNVWFESSGFGSGCLLLRSFLCLPVR